MLTAKVSTDHAVRNNNFVKFRDFGVERRLRVQDIDSPVLEAYAYAVAAKGRLKRGIADERDEVAVMAYPELEKKARSIVSRGSVAVNHGKIGMMFFLDEGRVRHLGYTN